MTFEAGTKVRLKNDPSALGTLTGRTRTRSGTVYYKVNFSNFSGYQPEYAIETFEEDEDWDELLENNKFGRPNNLRQHLTHIYLSGKLANLVYSMEATNTDFYAYQFKPVLSFLESPSNGLLIADEVGLGKTIEAGLVWTEIKARENAKRLLVVCPAMLREKWYMELKTKFGEDAVILNAHELHRELKQPDYIGKPKVMICSIQGLRPPKEWRDEKNTSKRALFARFLEEKSTEEPILDMLIIDEAHYLRNRETKSNRLARLLTNISRNNLLLTATPINLHSQDLFQLLHLIDRDNFDDPHVFPRVIDANEPLFRARTLAIKPDSNSDEIIYQLKEAQSNELLSNSRQLKSIIESDIDAFLTSDSKRVRLADKIDKINLLRHTYTRTRKKEVQDEFQVIRQPRAEFIAFDPNGPELDFYNRTTIAIKKYAKKINLPRGFLLSMPQRYLSSCMVAAASYWQGMRITSLDKELEKETIYEAFGEDSAEDENTEDRMPIVEYLQQEVLPYVDIEDLKINDSKYQRLTEVLNNILQENKNEKIILFSYFRNTLFYLESRLKEEKIASQILMGGMKENKQDIITKFRDDPNINILLSSEVASEGVDLQFCRILVNYDLPWNPMKVEQRIGRIDRIGQKNDQIFIWNLFHKGTIDEKIYSRLLKRLKIFERALGGVNDVIGPEIKELTHELMFSDLTEEEEDQKITQAAIALENRRLHEEQLEAEASSLIAHGGYILDQVQAAYDFNRRITDLDLKLYTFNYLNQYVQGYKIEPTDSVEELYKLSLTPEVMSELNNYINTNKLHGLTRLGGDPSTTIKFQNKVGFDPNIRKFETINQFHPLIRFISFDLGRRNEFFHPLVAAKLEAKNLQSLSLESGIYFFALNKWSFKGLRTEEELKARIIRMGATDYLETDVSWDIINEIRLNGIDWLTVDAELETLNINTMEVIENCIFQLDSDFEQSIKDREMENLDRIQFQKTSAMRKNDRRLDMLKQRLENFRNQDSKHRMIPATLGQIEAQQQRTEIRMQELNNLEKMTSSREEICVGVVKIQL